MKTLIFLLITMIMVFPGKPQSRFISTTIPYFDAAIAAPNFSDGASVAINPATLPGQRRLILALYMEKKYMTTGLSLGSLAVSKSSGLSGGGFMCRYFGNPSFNESSATLYYGRALGVGNIAGAFRWYRYHLAGFLPANLFSMSLFSLWKLSDRCHAILSVLNPAVAQLKKSNGSIAGEFRFGLAYVVDESVALSAEISAVDRAPPSAVGMLQYHFEQRFRAKFVVDSAGPQLFFGLAWDRNGWHTEISAGWHPALGLTPGTLLQYSLLDTEAR